MESEKLVDKPLQGSSGGADFTRSAVSRYIQLATLFRRRIQSGTWQVGKQVPTVNELSQECGVAPATIRQAIGLLEEEGLIKRQRAKGTFVLRRPEDALWCEVKTDWMGLLRSRDDAVIELLSNTVGPPPQFVPHPIGELAPTYRHLRRRHWRNDQPFLLADVYIDERCCKKIPEAEFTTKTAMRLVVGIPDVNIVDARQTLTLGSADIETAEYLKLPLNAPIAHVNRSAADDRGRLIFIAHGHYRGDVVRLDLKLK
jgi:GntR family transcriptional regulator